MTHTNTAIFVLCDTEAEYAQLMTEYLKTHGDIPWELYTYTDVGEMMREESKRQADMLVVAERAFSPEIESLQSKCLAVLNETGLVKWPGMRNINKYQSADEVFRELLELYAGVAGEQLPFLESESQLKIIGIYSPVRRCLQTTFALTLSRMLAENHAVLYMNFEHYAGITELLPDMQVRDMADLLYFLGTQSDRFRLRMQTIIRKNGKLDYIPPMKAGQNLLTVSGAEWLRLLKKIEETGNYEYVILDLSECIQGLFEILRRCARVFTLTKEDRISQNKLLQYEQLLNLCECGDVLQKTDKLCIPHIRRLPEELEEYTRGELADYVRKIAEELV